MAKSKKKMWCVLLLQLREMICQVATLAAVLGKNNNTVTILGPLNWGTE